MLLSESLNPSRITGGCLDHPVPRLERCKSPKEIIDDAYMHHLRLSTLIILMETIITLVKWPLILIGVFVAFLVYKFFISLYLQVRRYKAMDPTLKVFVRPIFGLQKVQQECTQQYGDSHHFVKEMMKENPDQKAYLTNLGDRAFLILTDIELIKSLSLNHRMFEKIKLLKHMELSYLKGIFFAEGSEWKGQKELVGPAFNHEHLTRMVPIMKKTINMYLDERKKNSNKILHVVDASETLIGEILVRTFFSNQIADIQVKGHNLSLALAEFSSMVFFRSRSPSNLFAYLLFGDRARSINFVAKDKELYSLLVDIRKVLFQLVDDRLNKPTEDFDFLQLYTSEMKKRQQLKAEAEKNGTEYNTPLISKEEVIQQLISFYFAGIDTTGHLLSFMFYTVAEYPTIARKLEEEIDKWIPNEASLTYEILQKLEYMEMYTKECLRMWPPAVGILARVAKEDITMGPYKITKGSFVGTNIIGGCHNPKYWKNPDVFDPDRWLEKEQLSEQPYAYIPFSAGPRSCIGKGLALMEAKIILIYFLKNFTLKRTDVPLRLTAKFLYEPVEGDLVRLDPKPDNAW